MAPTPTTTEAVLLAAGRGVRFWPVLPALSHKSMHEAGFGSPILRSTLEALLTANISRILLVHRPDDHALIDMVQNDTAFRGAVKLITQYDANGQGAALLRAASHLRGSSFFLIGPEKVNADVLCSLLENASSMNVSALLLTKATPPFTDYGIARCNGAHVCAVTEKPRISGAVHQNDRRIVGAYLFSQGFLRTLAHVQSRSPSHDSFERTLNLCALLDEARHISCDHLEVPSLKYPWHLLDIHQMLLRRGKRKFIHPSANIHPTAVIEGDVVIAEGVRIFSYAVIKGPCAIGAHAVIGDHTLVRGGCLIGPHAVIGAFTEVKGSIIGEAAHTHKNCILDSILERNVNVGAGSITANRRLDNGNISSAIQGERRDTLRTHLGAMIGRGASIGINVHIAPGTKIGACAEVGMNTPITKDVPDNTRIFFDPTNGILRERQRPA